MGIFLDAIASPDVSIDGSVFFAVILSVVGAAILVAVIVNIKAKSDRNKNSEIEAISKGGIEIKEINDKNEQ